MRNNNDNHEMEERNIGDLLKASGGFIPARPDFQARLRAELLREAKAGSRTRKIALALSWAAGFLLIFTMGFFVWNQSGNAGKVELIADSKGLLYAGDGLREFKTGEALPLNVWLNGERGKEARIKFRNGAQVSIFDRAEFRLSGGNALEIRSGRIYATVLDDQKLSISTPNQGEVLLSNNSLFVEVTQPSMNLPGFSNKPFVAMSAQGGEQRVKFKGHEYTLKAGKVAICPGRLKPVEGVVGGSPELVSLLDYPELDSARLEYKKSGFNLGSDWQGKVGEVVQSWLKDFQKNMEGVVTASQADYVTESEIHNLCANVSFDSELQKARFITSVFEKNSKYYAVLLPKVLNLWKMSQSENFDEAAFRAEWDGLRGSLLDMKKNFTADLAAFLSEEQIAQYKKALEKRALDWGAKELEKMGILPPENERAMIMGLLRQHPLMKGQEWGSFIRDGNVVDDFIILRKSGMEAYLRNLETKFDAWAANARIALAPFLSEEDLNNYDRYVEATKGHIPTLTPKEMALRNFDICLPDNLTLR